MERDVGVPRLPVAHGRDVFPSRGGQGHGGLVGAGDGVVAAVFWVMMVGVGWESWGSGRKKKGEREGVSVLRGRGRVFLRFSLSILSFFSFRLFAFELLT